MMRLISILVLCISAVVMPAWARVGGGNSYSGHNSGGGGGGGSGGGGGGGEIVWFLIQLCFAYPAIGVPLLVCIAVAYIHYSRQPGVPTYTSSGPATYVVPPPVATLEPLRATDPNFSTPVFFDFIQLLFARVHEAIGQNHFDTVAGFVDPTLLPRMRQALDARSKSSVKAVHDVVIGASTVEGVSLDNTATRVQIRFKSNVVQDHADGVTTEIYLEEQWTLQRKAGVVSKPPAAMRTLNCPNCGSAAQVAVDGTCKFCSQTVNDGRFGWVLTEVNTIERGPRPALGIDTGVEAGTNLPTVYSPTFNNDRNRFMIRDPKFSWAEFAEHVNQTFLALQRIWSSGKWEDARPYETDNLFNMHRFWMERYAREGLTNRLENVRVINIDPVKMQTDAFYDCITVRIFASMKDYTVDRSGKVVGGNPGGDRTFSEYWTFLRSLDYRPPVSPADGVPAAARCCPNCGAPLEITMTGACKYCDSIVTSGQFGFVLTAIEQDEEYVG